MNSVAVVDTGPGISAADQAQAIPGIPAGRQFHHQEKGRHRAGARDLQAHHRNARRKDLARIRVGEGSTFSFTVPTRAEQAEGQA